MSDRIESELSRIQEAIWDKSPETEPRWHELYAAQQALKWAQTPEAFASPFNQIMDIKSNLPCSPPSVEHIANTPSNA